MEAINPPAAPEIEALLDEIECCPSMFVEISSDPPPCFCDRGSAHCPFCSKWEQLTAGHIRNCKELREAITALRERAEAAERDISAIKQRAGDLAKELPRIVCLCGSTRFYEAFQQANYLFTMEGKIVLSVGFYPHAESKAHGEECGCTPEQTLKLDELHKRKIDLCDFVAILDVNGYIGESTRSEIEYAEKIGRPVYYIGNQFKPDEAANDRAIAVANALAARVDTPGRGESE